MGNVFADQNNTNKSSQRATNSNEQLDSSQQYTKYKFLIISSYSKFRFLKINYFNSIKNKK